MKPMNIEFLSEIARKEKEIPIVCSELNDTEKMSPLGALIWNARKHLKLTAETFAEKCDIVADDVERIENEYTYKPDIRTLDAISSFLGIKNKILAELAGYFKVKDPFYEQKLFSFAASSRRIRDCSDESMEVFEQYIAVLHERSVGNE
jgi:transcriptional regulator with XRE-family HTH domain